ncbi:hypothetical protein M4D21_07305, partial [Rothia kristinae]|uniref:hypothetical protein n=1 Tax=Rothia kristinae TaxID=37923 RepID=UPI0021A38321
VSFVGSVSCVYETASTAGAAALAVLQVLSGHWSQLGPGSEGADPDGTDPLTPDPDEPAASS